MTVDKELEKLSRLTPPAATPEARACADCRDAGLRHRGK